MITKICLASLGVSKNILKSLGLGVGPRFWRGAAPNVVTAERSLKSVKFE